MLSIGTGTSGIRWPRMLFPSALDLFSNTHVCRQLIHSPVDQQNVTTFTVAVIHRLYGLPNDRTRCSDIQVHCTSQSVHSLPDFAVAATTAICNTEWFNREQLIDQGNQITPCSYYSGREMHRLPIRKPELIIPALLTRTLMAAHWLRIQLNASFTSASFVTSHLSAMMRPVPVTFAASSWITAWKVQEVGEWIVCSPFNIKYSPGFVPHVAPDRQR